MESELPVTRTVGFVALGCPKNVVDSERMLGLIAQAGFIIDYDVDNADIVVINTCGFIQPAIDEANEVITKAVSRKQQGFIKKIIVAGCLSERLKQKLLEQFPDIDAVVCLGQRDNIVEVIGRVIEGAGEKFFASSPQWTETAQQDTDRLLINPSHWAYLRVSEGCNMNCSFCTIPSIKGRLRSKRLEDIILEANQLADAGVVELSIIAQDTANYGRDLGEADGLIKVINALEKIDTIRWVRLMYLNPAGISDALIEAIAGSDKVVHYLDIPIQHINDRILRLMHRPDSRRSITQLIGKLRQAIPDIVLRTTVIVGFPSETDAEFQELVDFIKEVRFDALGCFVFWPEQGTEAQNLAGQIPQNIRNARRQQLMLAQQRIAFEKNESRKGQVIECLVDEKLSPTKAIGRFYGQAPHIDSVCIIRNCPAEAGSFIKARVTGYEGYDLQAKMI